MSGSEAGDRRRIAITAAVVVTALAAAWLSGAELHRLGDRDGWASFTDLLGSLTSPDLSSGFLARIGTLAIESVLIGALGLALALVLATGLAVLAARIPGLPDDPLTRPWRLWIQRIIRATARGILVFYRSVPEILWAYLFVRILGLGAGPAVLAIGITFSGIIGKLFAELIEAADPEQIRLLRASGAGSVAVFLYGVLPQVRGQWIAYALFRLECAIRSASILGVVGAGGLGSEIDLSIRYFQYDKLATALLAVLAYVVVLELVSVALRRARPLWPVSLFVLGALAGLIWLDIPWGDIISSDAVDQFTEFAGGFLHPNTEASFVWHALELAAITVAMAWCATVVAAGIAFVLAPMSATTFTLRGYLQNAPRGRGPTRWAAVLLIVPSRLSLQLARSLPELIWALLFIVWVGPGVTAGILALTVHTTGILGRLFGDALEEAQPEPPRMIEATGAGPLARYLYGVLPQAFPRMLSFALFRFEVNIRDAAMVGFVGAGGLGYAMHTAISLFHMSDLATLVGMTIAAVLLFDWLGDRVRLELLR